MASGQVSALWCLQRPAGLLPKGFGLSTGLGSCAHWQVLGTVPLPCLPKSTRDLGAGCRGSLMGCGGEGGRVGRGFRGKARYRQDQNGARGMAHILPVGGCPTVLPAFLFSLLMLTFVFLIYSKDSRRGTPSRGARCPWRQLRLQ